MCKSTSLFQPILPEEPLEVGIALKQFDDGRNRLDENDNKENLCREEIDHDLFNQADLIDYNQVGSIKDFSCDKRKKHKNPKMLKCTKFDQ